MGYPLLARGSQNCLPLGHLGLHAVDKRSGVREYPGHPFHRRGHGSPITQITRDNLNAAVSQSASGLIIGVLHQRPYPGPAVQQCVSHRPTLSTGSGKHKNRIVGHFRTPSIRVLPHRGDAFEVGVE